MKCIKTILWIGDLPETDIAETPEIDLVWFPDVVAALTADLLVDQLVFTREIIEQADWGTIEKLVGDLSEELVWVSDDGNLIHLSDLPEFPELATLRKTLARYLTGPWNWIRGRGPRTALR